jgi:hypothetical protein
MTLKSDDITIEILKDGTVKFTTPKISGANHQSADGFLKQTAAALGGATETARRTGAPVHEHAHDHEHHSH